ncbi:hypothetical protein AC249_AIPGENE23283 [Exaiptasia diaphana]|nr:hypothetical protein AC249_AIPGENE23283 [Exaiptasia diaphana]
MAIESTYGTMQYGEAWKLVNRVTGRKRAKEGQVSGNSPEERVTTWFTHFQKLLGEPPTVEDPEEEIPTIYADLEINDEPFTLDEFRRLVHDGVYGEITQWCRMLRKALNVHWSSRTTNDEVYGELPRLDVKIAERRLRLAGHCYRHP